MAFLGCPVDHLSDEELNERMFVLNKAMFECGETVGEFCERVARCYKMWRGVES